MVVVVVGFKLDESGGVVLIMLLLVYYVVLLLVVVVCLVLVNIMFKLVLLKVKFISKFVLLVELVVFVVFKVLLKSGGGDDWEEF